MRLLKKSRVILHAVKEDVMAPVVEPLFADLVTHLEIVGVFADRLTVATSLRFGDFRIASGMDNQAE